MVFPCPGAAVLRGVSSPKNRVLERDPGEKRPRKTAAPGQGNTMAVKDGEGAKKAAKNSLT